MLRTVELTIEIALVHFRELLPKSHFFPVRSNRLIVVTSRRFLFFSLSFFSSKYFLRRVHVHSAVLQRHFAAHPGQ